MIFGKKSTHWGRVTHICISDGTITGLDNGLLSGWRHAIISTNAEILLIGPLGTNINEILSEIWKFSLKKMQLKMSMKWQPFCLHLNVLIRKSKDYVYGIWVYKALGIWKGYYRVKWLMVKVVFDMHWQELTLKSLAAWRAYYEST